MLKPSQVENAARVDAAIKHVVARTIDLVLQKGQSAEKVNAAVRAQTEIMEMIARVRRESAESGRGWTWHLLSVLDWTSVDIVANEKEGVRLQSLGDDDPSLADGRSDIELADRRKRIAAALDAYEAAIPDLEWSAARHQDQGGMTTALIKQDIRLGRGALLLAAEDCAEIETALSAIRRLDGGWRRRYGHVHAAAMRALIHLHDLGGRTEQAALADFIIARNEDLRPRPCPFFADAGDGAGAYVNVRKIFSRTGL